MSPTVFAYIGLFTLLLAGAAAAVEWGTQGRGVARHFWTVAILLAVLAPSGVLGVHAYRERTAASERAGGRVDVLATIIVSSGRSVVDHSSWLIGRDALIRLLAPSRRALHAALAGVAHDFAAMAVVAWLVLSTSLLVWLAVGVLYWQRTRRSWRRMTLDGISIDVSAATGPAVVGLLSHRIVLPAWATRMQPEHRRLVLAHESEHINARDPERLMLAIVALVLMPWNIGLWWCAVRLRRAIELDCDMRVLERHPGAKDYGHVLLEVAARGRNSGPLAIPMVALLRLPSELELRLRAMTSVRTMGMRSAILSVIAAVVAVSAAFSTPVPPLQLQRSAAVAHEATPSHIQSDTGFGRRQDSLAQARIAIDSLAKIDRAILRRQEALADTRNQVSALAMQRRELLNRVRATEPKPSGKRTYSTYFSFQVEKPARMLPETPTPVYPDKLRRAGTEGDVEAEFTVDTTGRVDQSAGIKITDATNDLFAAAVRSALPRMKFYPAEIGGHKVRQLVQQPFTFTIRKDP
ncbi:MAG TPA: M56 family metallopeptidase [Gemmatimonadaceae bacterium]|jgi:TonB family protein|nr:M56 family metallopeptidase [Gemmatimonadaceae bacterium]